MQPISAIDRTSPAPPVRPGGTIGDAFALLLDGIGGEDGNAERQAAAPGGKRLPVAAIDPALIVPPMAVQPVDTPPLTPVSAPPPPTGRAVPVPAMPDAAPLPDAISARFRPSPTDPDPPFVPSEVEGRAAHAAQGVSTTLDTNGGAEGANGAPGARGLDPAPVVRRPLPGEHAAPVVTLAPPRVAEAVVAGLTRDAARDDPRDAPSVERAGEPLPLVAADLAPRPILAADGGQAPRLDLRDDAGMQAMIDHIETLRDAGGATAGTRIRLSPDALGEVEVVLHHGDAGIEVRFASDNADAARALADAQPRLVELAQARGVRLGGMQVDVGGGRDAPRHDRPPPAARPARIASTGAPGADPATDDIRIA